jgi:hypothetical protein
MVKSVTRSDNRERSVWVWKGLDRTDLPRDIGQPFLLLEPTRVVDHRGDKIDTGDVLDLFGKGTNDKTGTTRNVEQSVVRFGAGEINH